jgi:hypothetical protein
LNVKITISPKLTNRETLAVHPIAASYLKLDRTTNHDLAEAAYQRGDYLEKRKKLMNDWADYCFSAVATNSNS